MVQILYYANDFEMHPLENLETHNQLIIFRLLVFVVTIVL